MTPLIQERFGEDPGALISYATVWQEQKKCPRGVKVQFTKDSRTTVFDWLQEPRGGMSLVSALFSLLSLTRV